MRSGSWTTTPFREAASLKKWLALSVGATFVIFLVVSFVIPTLWPWTELNCRHEDVDIGTGKLRRTRYFWFCKVSQRIVESSLSKALPADFVAESEPQWHRVYTFPPFGSVSPHYVYHAAIWEIDTLSQTWVSFDLPEDIKEQTARHVLALWQYTDTDYYAKKYIHGLLTVLLRGEREELLKSLRGMQMPRIQADEDRVTRTFFYPNGQPMLREAGFVDQHGRFVPDGLREHWSFEGCRRVTYYENGERHEGK